MASPEFEKQYAAILKKQKIQGGIPVSIADARKNFDNLVGGAEAGPDILLEPFILGGLVALRAKAPNVREDRAILFFHGGAYSVGSSWSHRDFLGRLSRASNCMVIGVDYRLAPEYPFPAALDDALASYYDLLRKNFEPQNIAFVGISAGAGLSLALMLALKEKKKTLPKCAACICPWVDLAMTGKTLQTNDGIDSVTQKRLGYYVPFYVGDNDPKNPLISPLYGDFRGFPPLYIQVGEREIVLDETTQLANKAKSQGVRVDLDIWPEMFHAWQLSANQIPEGHLAIEKIGAWLKDEWNF